MTIYLNGNSIEAEFITINSGLNYGRFDDNQTEVFEMKLSTTEFLSAIEKEYDSIKKEIQADDEAQGDTSEFSNTKYCSLQELLNHEIDLEAIFISYLDIPFFEKFFPPNSNNKYIINSTDSVCFSKNEITILGRAFNVPTISE